MAEYTITTNVLLVLILATLVILEFFLWILRYRNGVNNVIPRNMGVHANIVVQAVSIAGSVGGLEIALVADVIDRIRVYGLIGAVVLFGIGAIQYLSVLDEWADG